MNIEFFGQNALVEAEDNVFSFEVAESPRDLHESKVRNGESLDWSNTVINHHIDGWGIHPYGNNDNIPKVIKDVIQNNPKVPGIMRKKEGMLWGEGPKLYTEKFQDNILVRSWQDDPEAQAWLDSWDCEKYIQKCVTDVSHIQGAFTKYYRNKGGRFGSAKVAKLEHVSSEKARLAYRLDSGRPDPTHVMINDFTISHIDHLTNFKVYDLFDFMDPFKHPNSIYYSNMYSFCTDYYTVPDIYGSLEWIRRSTAVPLILKALSKNSINAKYHITSPQSFWDKVERDLQTQCTDKNKDYEPKMLSDYKTKFLRKISKVLSGEIQSGKYWHTVKTLNVDGSNIIEEGWEIKAIDQNIKEFVDTQIKIGETADQNASASVGVHTSIGGTGVSGRSDSGSEQLYALLNYLKTGVNIAEMIVMKPINYALKANFPDKKLKLGFYRTPIERQQDKSERDREKNQI
ncbi:hypothetical protein VS868_11995 [Salinimicrobium sp. 3283s]|uniref:hypothetical protein n=1 Tax=Salinimicrobium sp. 3283s TaxID=3114359 RepID=UPI0031EFB41B